MTTSRKNVRSVVISISIFNTVQLTLLNKNMSTYNFGGRSIFDHLIRLSLRMMPGGVLMNCLPENTSNISVIKYSSIVKFAKFPGYTSGLYARNKLLIALFCEAVLSKIKNLNWKLIKDRCNFPQWNPLSSTKPLSHRFSYNFAVLQFLQKTRPQFDLIQR